MNGVTVSERGSIFSRFWAFLMGPEAEVVAEAEPTPIVLPPPPMFRDPRDGEWKPL